MLTCLHIHCLLLLLQESLTGIPEEQRPIVNVDGERPLAVVRASGAKSDISIGSQHFGAGVAIGEQLHKFCCDAPVLIATASWHLYAAHPDSTCVQLIGTFEIEDLLVGTQCRQHRFLARSYESLDTAHLPSVSDHIEQCTGGM